MKRLSQSTSICCENPKEAPIISAQKELIVYYVVILRESQRSFDKPKTVSCTGMNPCITAAPSGRLGSFNLQSLNP